MDGAKKLLVASVNQLFAIVTLDKALLARPAETEVTLMDPNDTGGEETPLTDLVPLLCRNSFGANNIAV